MNRDTISIVQHNLNTAVYSIEEMRRLEDDHYPSELSQEQKTLQTVQEASHRLGLIQAQIIILEAQLFPYQKEEAALEQIISSLRTSETPSV